MPLESPPKGSAPSAGSAGSAKAQVRAREDWERAHVWCNRPEEGRWRLGDAQQAPPSHSVMWTS